MNVAETAPLQSRHALEDFGLLPRSAQTRDSVVIQGSATTVSVAASTALPATDVTTTILANALLAGTLIAGSFIGNTDHVRIEHLSIPALADRQVTNDPGLFFGTTAPRFEGFSTLTLQSSTGVLPRNAVGVNDVGEMVLSTQSIRTVASAVFNDVRPLTDKERRYLRRFYNRAYKLR